MSLTRRQYIVSAAILGGTGYLLFGVQPGDVDDTIDDYTDDGGPELGGSQSKYERAGVQNIGWQDDDDYALRISLRDDPAPTDAALYHPDGERLTAWETAESPLVYPVGVPLTRGDWTLATTVDGERQRLDIPVYPAVEITRFELVDGTVHVDIEASGTAPVWLNTLGLDALNRYSELYRLKTALMVNDTYEWSTNYPFDHYEDVEASVQIGRGETATTTSASADFR